MAGLFRIFLINGTSIYKMGTQPSFNKIVLFSLFVFLIVPLKPIYAEKLPVIQKKEVVVAFEEPLRAAAEEFADIYPMVKKDLEKTLGWRVDFRPTIMLIKESKTFQMMAGSNLIVAFAVPQKRLIVIDYSKMKTDPFTIELTMKHELCHLLLHNHLKNGNLHRWFDEGIAQWVSGGMAEIIMSQKRSPLNEATLVGKYIKIRSLTERFPRDRKYIFLAYEESKSLVEYIIGKFGIDGILTILKHLKEGKEMDAAVLKALSISFDELEEGWHNHLKKNITWFTYLSNNLYEILFFLAALIMIYGFIRRLMIKRAYMDGEEEND